MGLGAVVFVDAVIVVSDEHANKSMVWVSRLMFIQMYLLYDNSFLSL